MKSKLLFKVFTDTYTVKSNVYSWFSWRWCMKCWVCCSFPWYFRYLNPYQTRWPLSCTWLFIWSVDFGHFFKGKNRFFNEIMPSWQNQSTCQKISWLQCGVMSNIIQCYVMLLTFVLLYTIFTVLSFWLKYCIFPICKMNLGSSLQQNIYTECVELHAV